MGRMGKDGYSNADTTQISGKVPEELKEEYRAACDEKGISMTDKHIELMSSFVDDVFGDEKALTDGGDDLPKDIEKGYLALRKRCDPDTGKIDVETAETAVSEGAKVKKDGARRRVLDPLERRNLIEYHWGTIRVNDPAQATR